MRVGNEFWMWLSGGFSRDGVKIYRFTSANGLDWTIANGGKPVLVPGDKDADDFEDGVTDPFEAITGLGLAKLPRK